MRSTKRMSKNEKNRLDFQIAAFKIKPDKWVVHHCTICNYPCGFVFAGDWEIVAYDNGCDCVRGGYKNVSPVSWGRLADHYNSQTNEDYIKEMNKFWGFDNA